MMEVKVGIRNLRNQLSEHLRRVREGQTILITDHGKVVARILPVERSLEDKLQDLQEAGLLSWSGEKLSPITPPAVNKGDIQISDLISAMRE
jgi:prevent-host-death family protein